MSNDGFERVALLDDLPMNTPTSVERDGEPICLVRIGKEVYAISNNCTHADFPMGDGEMVEDFVIECGLHGAQFDLRDGTVAELPATESIGCYEVKLEDGGVWVRAGQ